MILKEITFTEAKISPKFADYVNEICKNDDCPDDNLLDAFDLFEGDVTPLLYSCDSLVLMHADNNKGISFTLRGTPETINLIVSSYIKHLENQAANDDDDLSELLS